MTDTTGWIPIGWRRVRLDAVGVIVTGGTPPTHDRSYYGVAKMFASPADLGDTKYVTSTAKRLSLRGFKRSRRMPAGTTLFVCIGSTIGKVGLAIEELTANQQINAIIPDERMVDHEYLYYAATTLSSRVRDQAGEQAVPLVNKSDFSAFEVLLPSIGEQRAIASVLANADRMVGTLERLIAKKQAIKQGMMQELFTGNTRLSGFSKPWTPAQLGDIASMGSGGTPPSGNTNFYGGGVPWVSISDMTSASKYVRTIEKTLTSEGLAHSAARIYDEGVVLYAMYASLGECAIPIGRVSSSQAILGIKPGPKLDQEFLYYYLTFIRNEVKKMGQQGTQSNLNAGMVRKFTFNLPAIEEQRAIASVLANADDELGVLRTRLTKARAIKQGMMQQLLTGQTRLPIGGSVR